jgi:hypothetical protein
LPHKREIVGLVNAVRKKSSSLLVREESMSALSDHLYLVLNRNKIARLSRAKVIAPSPDAKATYEGGSQATIGPSG